MAFCEGNVKFYSQTVERRLGIEAAYFIRNYCSFCKYSTRNYDCIRSRKSFDRTVAYIRNSKYCNSRIAVRSADRRRP